jgi:O-antigen/teichoic acid export membrane protein
VHTLFGPARILSYVMRLMLPITFAKSINSEGDASMQRKLRAMLIVAVPLFGGYCILIALLADPLMRLAFGDDYAGYRGVVALYALAMFISYMAMIIISALKAQRRTRRVFFNRLAASLIAIPVGVALIHYTGLHGAVGGMIASYTALIVLSCFTYRGMTNTNQKDAP